MSKPARDLQTTAPLNITNKLNNERENWFKIYFAIYHLARRNTHLTLYDIQQMYDGHNWA